MKLKMSPLPLYCRIGDTHFNTFSVIIIVQNEKRIGSVDMMVLREAILLEMDKCHFYFVMGLCKCNVLTMS